MATSRQWIVDGQDGVKSLKLTEQNTPPLGDSEYRDLLVTQGKYPWTVKPGVVPGSDGAGVVLSVGKNVTRFGPSDKVITMLNQQHVAGPMTAQIAESGIGASIDGTFRSIGVFDEQGLVAMPECLSFIEAATLSCAGLTAWNALFGLPGKQLMAGQWILTQGTGGVSLFAVQLAKAVGARVIAMTSSSEKAKLLERLGADHIINYSETPDWGAVAKELTGGVGVDLVVEVAGPKTLKQSAHSLKLDGMMSVVGFVGGEAGSEDVPTLLDCWINLFTSRGIWVGSRMQLEELCRAIEGNPDRLRPIIDEQVFALDGLRSAYDCLSRGENLGKVCIKMN